MTQPLSSKTVGTATTIPTLTNAQTQAIYRLMVEEYGLGQHVLVENAGRSLGALARRLVRSNMDGQPITVLAGAGNCGAAGLATARYLVGAGADVTVILARPLDLLSPVAAHQHRVFTRMSIKCFTQGEISLLKLIGLLRQSVLVLDALIGGGLRGWPTGAEAFLIQALRQAGRPVLALDLPSGLPPDGERPPKSDLAVRAEATLALGLPRVAHTQLTSFKSLGELYLAEAGIPPTVYSRLGLTVGPLFSASEIILLRRPPKPGPIPDEALEPAG